VATVRNGVAGSPSGSPLSHDKGRPEHSVRLVRQEQPPHRLREPADSLDVEDWLQESHRLARDLAYDGKILATVRTADENSGELDKIELPDSYYSVAGVGAKRRIVEAGYRLGGILDGLIE
jgi:hypothetical protein